MNGLAIGFLAIEAVLLFTLPRRWVVVPILAVACYMPLGAGFDLGPFNFYGARVVLSLAFMRMLMFAEGPVGGMNKLDWAIIAWSLVALLASLFYPDVPATLTNRAGAVFMACGPYFALRTYCTDQDDVVRLCRSLALLLVPLSAAMLYEKLTATNPFAEFGSVSSVPEIRNGTVRAQGAFSHSILAGSIGAACLPLMAVLWRTHRLTARAGVAACLTMVFSSGSSGPIMGTVFGTAALLIWRLREYTRLMRWSAVAAYMGLAAVMNAPAYYIISYIDLTGSSTSWHRAALIETTLAHFSEWWLAGTSYTRHWMAYGVGWSGNHIDITNYYIRMAVDGGLPLMLAFIVVLAHGFSLAGNAVYAHKGTSGQDRFLPWALGASLFAHASNFISVSYFDQSVMFLYMTLAAISAASRPVPDTTDTTAVSVKQSQPWQKHKSVVRPKNSLTL